MWREETGLFWLEIALLVVGPVVLLNLEKVRITPLYLYWTCAMIVAGFVTNRLNVSVTALQASSATYYIPKWTEFAATLATIAAAVVAFRYAVVYLDILPEPAPPALDGPQCARASVNRSSLNQSPGRRAGFFIGVLNTTQCRSDPFTSNIVLRRYSRHSPAAPACSLHR